MGRIDELLKARVINLVIRVACIVWAAHYSIVQVAASQVLYFILGYFVLFHFIKPFLKFRHMDMIAVTWKSVFVTLTSSIVPAFALFYMRPGPENLWAPLLVGGIGMGIGWLLGIYLFKHSFGAEITNTLQLTIKHIKGTA